MEECLFCRIVRGEIPSRVVYEDDVVFAFDDIAPQAPVHTLVVPKHHYRDLGDGIPIETLGALFAAVPRVAELKGVNESGYRVIVNNGPDAGQTVHHVHIHVMGGRHMSHGMVNFVGEA